MFIIDIYNSIDFEKYSALRCRSKSRDEVDAERVTADILPKDTHDVIGLTHYF